MAGKVKFNQEVAFKSIIGAGREAEAEIMEQQPAAKGKNKDRVQRSYFLDQDVDRALKRKALEEGKNLTESINEALRKGLFDYL